MLDHLEGVFLEGMREEAGCILQLFLQVCSQLAFREKSTQTLAALAKVDLLGGAALFYHKHMEGQQGGEILYLAPFGKCLLRWLSRGWVA